MKAQGEEEVQPYMKAMLAEMGIEPNDIDNILGERPSYYAQMEFLTKKLYQYPAFYSNLYDKPANVDRKHIAMQAIALMQKRDMYRSIIRSEMSQSILLETSLRDLEDKYINEQLPLGETRLIREVFGAL